MFLTSLSWRVEVIASLIPIHFHLNKIIGQHYLWVMSLPKQHIINSLLDKHHSKKAKPHYIATAHLTFKKWLRIKSFIVDTNNWLNEIFPSFNSLNKELSLGFCLVDTFFGHFSFHPVNQKDANTKITHCNRFDSIYEDSLIDQNTYLSFLMLVLKTMLLL